MDYNYYSIAFLYKAAVRGVSGPGFHMSFYVDERKESNRLSKALDLVCESLNDLLIEHRSEYCFPDGSLLRYVRSEYGIIELSMLLESKLKGMKFEIVPLAADYPAHYGEEETLEYFFNTTVGERAYRKKALMKFVAKAVLHAKSV